MLDFQTQAEYNKRHKATRSGQPYRRKEETMKNYKATYENQNGEQKILTIKAMSATQGLLKGLALRKSKNLEGYALIEIEPEVR